MRMLPRLSLAAPTVAGCRLAVCGGAEEPLELLPQLATASAASTSTVALATNVIDLVRVMLAPFVEWVNGSPSEHAVAWRRSRLGLMGELPSRARWSTHSQQRGGSGSPRSQLVFRPRAPNLGARALSWSPMILALRGSR